MGRIFFREGGKTQGGFVFKLKELARKVSMLPISTWHFPK